MTTSPSRLRPPVVSRSRSHASQSAPVQASQASGGQVGSTPTPSIVQANRSRSAFDGAGSLRPMKRRSPGFGWLSKARKSRPLSASVVRSTCFVPSTDVKAAVTETGTIGRSSRVVKTIAWSGSVRIVAACVPPGMRTACGCGPESQNVTSPRAADGGKSRIPISSRNLT